MDVTLKDSLTGEMTVVSVDVEHSVGALHALAEEACCYDKVVLAHEDGSLVADSVSECLANTCLEAGSTVVVSADIAHYVRQLKDGVITLSSGPAWLSTMRVCVRSAMHKDRLAFLAYPAFRDDIDLALFAMEDSGAAHRMTPTVRDSMRFMYGIQLCFRRHASSRLKNDFVFMHNTFLRNRHCLDIAGQEVLDDKRLAVTVVQHMPSALSRFSERLLADRDVVLLAMRQRCTTPDAFRSISIALQHDPEVLSLATRNHACALDLMPDALRDSKADVLCALRTYPQGVFCASPRLQQDPDVLSLAFKQNLRQPFPIERITNQKVLLEYVKHQEVPRAVVPHLCANVPAELLVAARGVLLGMLDVEHRDDKKVVLLAVAQRGTAVQYASERLRGDVEVALAAVRSRGAALQFVSPGLRDNREVVLAAVRQSARKVKFASRRLRADRDVALTALRLGCAYTELRYPALTDVEVTTASGAALRHLDANDKPAVLAAVRTSCVLKYAHPDLKDDAEVVLAAVAHSHRALRAASARLRGSKEVLRKCPQLSFADVPEEVRMAFDKGFVLEMLQSNRARGVHALSTVLKEDADVVLAAVKACPGQVFQFRPAQRTREVMMSLTEYRAQGDKPDVPTQWDADAAFMLEAVQRCGKMLRYATHEAQNDKELVLKAVAQDGTAIVYASQRLQQDKDVLAVVK